MKAKRVAAGVYQLSGATTLDGRAAHVRFSIWRHEEIPRCWMVETEIDGASTGCYGDYGSKAEAMRAAKRCAEVGCRRVGGLGICLN